MHDARNLADVVRRAAERDPDRRALINADQTITWGQLDAQVDAVARELHRTVPDPTARIVIALPNVPAFAAAYFGVLRAGLVAVPVNPGYTPRELRYVLSDADAAALFATPDGAASVAGVDVVGADVVGADVAGADVAGVPGEPAVHLRVYAGQALDDLLAEGGSPVQVDTDPESLAVLLYTSGTAGAPKGAMLSHRALLANHAQLSQVEPRLVGPDDIVLLALPLFHAYGLNSGLGAVAYHGATGVLVERFDPADTLDLVDRHHVTAIIGVPPMFVAWSLLPASGEALTSVRLMVSGAAPLEPAAAARFTAATARPIFEGYGLTETAPVLTITVVSPVPKTGSIGRPIPGVELRLVGADGSTFWPTVEDEDTDVDLHAPDSPGTDPGEIVVRGANLFSGYWPDGRDGPDAEGWWATGDVAYADGDGDLFLVDRLNELILVSGFNVYPREVEQVITAHPGIAEAAAVAIPHPYTGQTVKAFVVRAPGSTVDTETLMRHCEANLARFKCPTAIEFVPELPYSIIGKVRKAALRAG